VTRELWKKPLGNLDHIMLGLGLR